jgi:hypothetical protein
VTTQQQGASSATQHTFVFHLENLAINDDYDLLVTNRNNEASCQYLAEPFSQKGQIPLIRDPWEIVWSYYNLVIASAGLPNDGTATQTWLNQVAHMAAWSFEEFVAIHVLSGDLVPRGGFLQKFANLPGVHVLTSVSDAYELLKNLTGHDPVIATQPFTAAPDHPLAADVRKWCGADMSCWRA